MLEGAVARLFNYFLGKYVVDLDTENLNVGIFSGQVQLTDLKLKPEALYELKLPIEVIAGTIGKIRLQIPWTALWNQVVTINIEDIHITCSPIIANKPFDAEKNKRLLRAFKKKILNDLDTERQFIGGPNSFADCFLANILHNLQIVITNVHLRYEDNISYKNPISAGLCIGTITAETTNSKWKPSSIDNDFNVCYYLIKIETLSTYWNTNAKLKTWVLPSEYYAWRNSMSQSLQNFTINDQPFNFVVKPMTTKLKMTINKSANGNIIKSLTDVIFQDCNIQLSKDQYDSILSVENSLQCMFISWNFIHLRPHKSILSDKKRWWKYAYLAVIEQRIKPYLWKNIKTTRDNYKNYMTAYKQVILSPNDTELKLDLQMYEDNLSIVSIVIARQQARVLLKSESSSEKSFWAMLSSPERATLCKSIGFYSETCSRLHLERQYNVCMGNVSLSLINNSKEIFILTCTQFNLCYFPNPLETNSFKLLTKMEGLILEGLNEDDQLTSIVASEHLGNSPAYFFQMELSKTSSNSKLHLSLNTLECIYNNHFFNEMSRFLQNEFISVTTITEQILKSSVVLPQLIKKHLSENANISLNLKIPLIVFPENGASNASHLMIFDMGHYIVTTEICSNSESLENTTKMEMEEQLYSKLHIHGHDFQILFCQNFENWRDARKEKDTDLHLLPKTEFKVTVAKCTILDKAIPRYKINMEFSLFKVNLSERKILQFLKFAPNNKKIENLISNKKTRKKDTLFDNDVFIGAITLKYLRKIKNLVNEKYTFVQKEKSKTTELHQENYRDVHNNNKEDINELWARCVDLPGLEDNVSPNNNIILLGRLLINEIAVTFSRSSDRHDRQYLLFRLGIFTIDGALMTFGPAFQVTVNSVLVTDKLHTISNGQYLDLVYSPFPSTVDVITILYRQVSASCPDFWSHFHGVETSLVADFGAVNLLLHQEAIHTLMKYLKYLSDKIKAQIPCSIYKINLKIFEKINSVLHQFPKTPIPPGSVKFSHSARLADLNIRICDVDFDIINIQLAGLEMDFLFRANERFVFRSYLGTLNVEQLSDVTLYNKIVSTDEDKVFELKYVRQASDIIMNDIIKKDQQMIGGSFKFQLGQIHLTIIYKVMVQIQRFVLNLELWSYLNDVFDHCYKAASAITDTLKGNTKIHMAINICGPVLLLPQNSSSPNVLIIDTGELTIENFFKMSSDNTVENILLKWIKITFSKGVMTLIPTLEMQEILIEPLGVNFDIKKHSKSAQHIWDVVGTLESIQITLGQKDVILLLSIFKENFGERSIRDIFVNTQLDNAAVGDKTVETLEAFFCEPKQKNVFVKFSLEEISLLLFFDSGEILSSPIRDLNHGLCKWKLLDIILTCNFYTDGSLDGKFTTDNIQIEEIGLEANIFDKEILQSPFEHTKNNCNITINKVPLIDITFHQNTTEDKSIDIIIGRLCFKLSVPLCEKIAMFILECFPINNVDSGIINHGYEYESTNINLQESKSSIAIAIRINKPEFVFVIETTSNRKRYFLTHAEILSDYSRHGSRLNFVLSLSGLHTIFCDEEKHLIRPYVILKQCDVEWSYTNNEEKCKRALVTISSIYVQINTNIIHCVTDILHDISEHFKVPENEALDCVVAKSTIHEELWEPKKIEPIVKTFDENIKECSNKFDVSETLLIPSFEIILICDLEDTQVILLKSTAEAAIYDWSTLLNSICNFSIQINYFNEHLQVWEPLIDPVTISEQEYKAWEFSIKVFQDKPLIMLGGSQANQQNEKKGYIAATTEEDEDSNEDMMYLKPKHSFHQRNNQRVKNSLSTFLEDSDSENEDATIEKLTTAISDLFTGDWNETEDSDYILSSENEDDSEDSAFLQSSSRRTSNLPIATKSTYFLFESKEVLNITITPIFLRLFNDLLNSYSKKTLLILANKDSINILNDIGPETKIELFEKQSVNSTEEDILICTKTFENQDSAPSSPNRESCLSNDIISEKKHSIFEDSSKIDEKNTSYDFETISSLQFIPQTTSEIYENINKHFLRIYIPNCLPVETSCTKKCWQKFINFRSTSPVQNYYLLAKQSISKCGRKIVISSPLQVRNETCFALNILYQPSVLQQMNLEPVGDVPNPFETTMRIAILEAHEQYNVPLYIAYHCKLFIQPAHTEAHYTTDSGIWWKDLATDLEIPHNFKCIPKNTTSFESFYFRVMLTQNLDLPNFQRHAVPNYIIYLFPPLIFYNFLPYSLEIKNHELKQEIKIEPGEKKSVYSLNISKDQKLELNVKYNLLIWSGVLNFTTFLDEKLVPLSSENKDLKQPLTINIKTDREKSCIVYLYNPYWLVNKIGFIIQIRSAATNIVYENNPDEILLFTFKRHTKQTINIRVNNSSWSNEFGLESAGTTGLIVCKDAERKKKYMIFLSITLSKLCPRLTKIVTFHPGFIVVNQTSKNLRFMEHNEKTDLWIDLDSKQSLIFWPDTSSMQMYVKYKDSKSISPAFNFITPTSTVLRIDKGEALTVNISGGVHSSFEISFDEYKFGDAPVLVKNYCPDIFLKIQQQAQSQVTLLSPNTSLLYTWDDPIKIRKIVWNVYNNKSSGFVIDINKDSFGEEKIQFYSVTPTTSLMSSSSSEDSDNSDGVKTALNKKIRKDKLTIYWLCFKDGLQKCLLFTQEQKIFTHMVNIFFLETCHVECFLSMSGIGASIFTKDNSKKEHLYCCLADTPAIWEVNVGQKWKILTLELATWIEDKYKLGYKKCQLRDYVHIDFVKMYMLKPFFAELKRTYTPAIYAQYRRSMHYQHFNLKVNTLQIDNKMNNSIILYPAPQNSNKELMFFDLNVLKYSTKTCDIYKYIKINIKDFYLNIETNVVLDLKELLLSLKRFREEKVDSYVQDMKYIQNLKHLKSQNIYHFQTIIEILSISNFQIHLNVTNNTQFGVFGLDLPFFKALNYLFPINISYMTSGRVTHKISAFQQINLKAPFFEAFRIIKGEILSEFLQQYYSHVLGLHVLVNPLAMQRTITNIQGDAQETFELLLYGLKCLLNHILMSSAALEQVIGDIFKNQTLENIQRMQKHRSYYESSQKIPEIIEQFNQNFVNVPNALNQLLDQNPNVGPSCDGELFFNTTGKALYYLISRYPDDKSNNIDLAKEAIKRASILGEPFKIHQRLTRYCIKPQGIKPFSAYESIGQHMLETVSNCQFINNLYWAHAAVDNDGKSILLVSLENVLRINKCRLWGRLDLEWALDLDDITSIPQVTAAELIINLRQNEKNASELALKVEGNLETLTWIREKIEQAMILSMERKSWMVTKN